VVPQTISDNTYCDIFSAGMVQRGKKLRR